MSRDFSKANVQERRLTRRCSETLRTSRPFLEVYNGFERPLHYRALARLKGSKKFFEIREGVEPVPAAGGSNKCWEFGSLVEEVVLYQFALSEKPAK